MRLLKRAQRIEIYSILQRSWDHHQEILQGLEKIRSHMEHSEIELESAMQLSALKPRKRSQGGQDV